VPERPPEEAATEPPPDAEPAFDPAVGWTGLGDEEAGASAPAPTPAEPDGDEPDWEAEVAAFDPAIGWTDPQHEPREEPP
jgi:hypothetical protein